jgi:hypothetical protein
MACHRLLAACCLALCLAVCGAPTAAVGQPAGDAEVPGAIRDRMKLIRTPGERALYGAVVSESLGDADSVAAVGGGTWLVEAGRDSTAACPEWIEVENTPALRDQRGTGERELLYVCDAAGDGRSQPVYNLRNLLAGTVEVAGASGPEAAVLQRRAKPGYEHYVATLADDAAAGRVQPEVRVTVGGERLNVRSVDVVEEPFQGVAIQLAHPIQQGADTKSVVLQWSGQGVYEAQDYVNLPGRPELAAGQNEAASPPNFESPSAEEEGGWSAISFLTAFLAVLVGALGAFLLHRGRIRKILARLLNGSAVNRDTPADERRRLDEKRQALRRVRERVQSLVEPPQGRDQGKPERRATGEAALAASLDDISALDASDLQLLDAVLAAVGEARSHAAERDAQSPGDDASADPAEAVQDEIARLRKEVESVRSTLESEIDDLKSLADDLAEHVDAHRDLLSAQQEANSERDRNRSQQIDALKRSVDRLRRALTEQGNERRLSGEKRRDVSPPPPAGGGRAEAEPPGDASDAGGYDRVALESASALSFEDEARRRVLHKLKETLRRIHAGDDLSPTALREKVARAFAAVWDPQSPQASRDVLEAVTERLDDRWEFLAGSQEAMGVDAITHPLARQKIESMMTNRRLDPGETVTVIPEVRLNSRTAVPAVRYRADYDAWEARESDSPDPSPGASPDSSSADD